VQAAAEKARVLARPASMAKRSGGFMMLLSSAINGHDGNIAFRRQL